MKVLVTGVNGFVGKHLARELQGRGHRVIGVGREPKPHPLAAELLSDYAVCDLTKTEDVAALPLAGLGAIINLAGLARVGDSFKDPDKYIQLNVSVLAVLGERLVRENNPLRLIAISTGAVYNPHQALPLTEESAISMDNSPYAISKLKMEEVADEFRAKGLNCVIVRPFNHIGPGQEPGFLVPDLYQKIDNALKSGQPVEVGNLKTKRDYTDVRDVVKAYADLAEADKLSHDLYNVCSSKSIDGQQILNTLLEIMGANGKVVTKVNPEFIRPNDAMDLYGSNQRLAGETGWSPKINLKTTLNDFVRSTST